MKCSEIARRIGEQKPFVICAVTSDGTSGRSNVVEMRFFGGLSVEETAEALSVSVDTVMRDCKLAKAWLLPELKSGWSDDK
jgi:hypothetical protein